MLCFFVWIFVVFYLFLFCGFWVVMLCFFCVICVCFFLCVVFIGMEMCWGDVFVFVKVVLGLLLFVGSIVCCFGGFWEGWIWLCRCIFCCVGGWFEVGGGFGCFGGGGVFGWEGLEGLERGCGVFFFWGCRFVCVGLFCGISDVIWGWLCVSFWRWVYNLIRLCVCVLCVCVSVFFFYYV